MLKQIEIDFTHTVHQSENNRESEMWLEENYERLNDQCKRLLKIFLNGGRFTVLELMTKHFIGDPRRRIKDLRDDEIINKHYRINDKRLENGCKEYWIEKIVCV